MDPWVELASRPFRWFINAIGGTLRYFYGTLIRALRLTKRRPYSYHEYLNGPTIPEEKLFDRDAHRFNNGMIALLCMGLLFTILKAC
ncbi:MAG: hypothetical protein KF797_08195 [Flavobacteriales bacterium]|nr:hypothetical protein [Flavobacteriales bacterium]